MEKDFTIKKKKILFLLEAFDKGGIEQVTLDIVNHLNPEKYDITIQVLGTNTFDFLRKWALSRFFCFWEELMKPC